MEYIDTDAISSFPNELTDAELEKIVETLGATYSASFTFSDGIKI